MKRTRYQPRHKRKPTRYVPPITPEDVRAVSLLLAVTGYPHW